ncbi:MAG: hypothetical protein LYZ69_09570 [Nitrososphaerales archaeon]|nr:hypothetical protein [Nitrososphaerales archaeon]
MRPAFRDYFNKNCNLELLADAVEEHFQVEGYETQSGRKDEGWVVQARKGGALRELLAADRAFTITVAGGPANFRVTFGIGKWLQNLGVAVVEGIAIAPLVTFVEIPISLWSYEIEREFWSYVEKQVELRI